MTNDSSRECGGSVNQSSSMSNPDPSRAALADELERVRQLVREHIGPTMDKIVKRSVAALRSPLPGRLDCGAKEVRALLDRNHRYLDSMAGRNELHCGPLMLNHALIESTELIELLCTPALPPTLNSGAVPNGLFRLIDKFTYIDEESGQCRFREQYTGMDLVNAILALPRAVEGGAVERSCRHYLDAAMRWHPVFDDGRGSNDLTFSDTLDLLATRLRAALSPKTGDGK